MSSLLPPPRAISQIQSCDYNKFFDSLAIQWYNFVLGVAGVSKLQGQTVYSDFVNIRFFRFAAYGSKFIDVFMSKYYDEICETMGTSKCQLEVSS